MERSTNVNNLILNELLKTIMLIAKTYGDLWSVFLELF